MNNLHICLKEILIVSRKHLNEQFEEFKIEIGIY
jgi:hypothetical protein